MPYRPCHLRRGAWPPRVAQAGLARTRKPWPWMLWGEMGMFLYMYPCEFHSSTQVKRGTWLGQKPNCIVFIVGIICIDLL